MLRHCTLRSSLVVLLAAGLCAAQPPDRQGGGDDDGPRRGRRGQRDGQREGGRRGQGGFQGRRGADPKAQLERMTKAVDLDDEQQDTIGKLLEENAEKTRALREEFRPDPADMDKFRELREAMRDARDDGDTDALEAIREEMQEAREAQRESTAPLREKMEAARKELQEAIVENLNPDQVKAFETFWAEQNQRGRRRGPTVDPRTLKVALDKLKLTTQQETQVKDLYDAFKEAQKEAEKNRTQGRRGGRGERGEPGTERGGRGGRGGGDRANRRGGRGGRGGAGNQLQQKLYDDVMKVLNTDQKAEIEKRLQRDRGNRGERRRGEGREGRGRFTPPERRA